MKRGFCDYLATSLLLAIPFLAGCGGEKPKAASTAENASKDSAETARLRLEVQSLSERLAVLERQAETPRTLGKSSGGAGAITDDVLISLLRSGEELLMRGAVAVAKKQPSARLQEVLIEMGGNTLLQANIRSIAIEGLQGQRNPVIQTFWTTLLNDSNEQLVAQAANELGQQRSAEHVPLLVAALKRVKIQDSTQQYNNARYQLLGALKGVDEPIVLAAAVEGIKSPSQHIRDQSATLLASLRSEAAIQEILNLLQSTSAPKPNENYYVFNMLLGAVGSSKDPQAAPLFAKLLESENVSVVQTCLDQLQNVGGPEQVPQLLKALAQEFRREQAGDKSAVWRTTSIAKILGKVGGAPAWQALLDLAERTHQPGVAQEALNGLSRVATAEQAADLVALHKRLPAGQIKQGLEGILRNGKFEVRWLEKEGRFTTEPLQVEADAPISKPPMK